MRLGSLQPKFDKIFPSPRQSPSNPSGCPLPSHGPNTHHLFFFFYSEPDHGFGANSTMRFSATGGRSSYMPPRKEEVVLLEKVPCGCLAGIQSQTFSRWSESFSAGEPSTSHPWGGERTCRGLEPSEAKASGKMHREPSPKLGCTCPEGQEWR